MNLPVFTSKAGGSEPNLVGVQNPHLTQLPTVLVCPIKRDLAATSLRPRIVWAGRNYIVGCDLVRPIRRTALRLLGHLSDAESDAVLAAQLALFPQKF